MVIMIYQQVKYYHHTHSIQSVQQSTNLKKRKKRRNKNLEMISPDNFNFIKGLIRIPTSLTIDTSGVSDPNTRIDYNPLDSRLQEGLIETLATLLRVFDLVLKVKKQNGM